MDKTARVKLITNSDVIGAIQHQIVMGNLRQQRRFIQQGIQQGELHIRVDAHQRRMGRLHFRLAEGGIAVQGLALQVRERHRVEIEQRHATHARSSQILRCGTA